MNTLERIRKLFLENFDFQPDQLTPEATVESLGLDSLDKIEFLFVLEKEFGIKIPDREVTINSIQDMIDVIEKLSAEQRASTTREGV